MDAEIIPFPNKGESILNTLESLQECFDLAEAIDDQVAFWRAQSRAPSMRYQSLAQSIADDCEPLGREPIDYRTEAAFGGSMTLGDAIARTEYEKRRAVLTEWVSNKAIDTVAAQNQRYGEYFIEAVGLGDNPSIPERFRTAALAVHRLFLVREQLALKLGRNDDNFESGAFAEVMNRLISETF